MVQGPDFGRSNRWAKAKRNPINDAISNKIKEITMDEHNQRAIETADIIMRKLGMEFPMDRVKYESIREFIILQVSRHGRQLVSECADKWNTLGE